MSALSCLTKHCWSPFSTTNSSFLILPDLTAAPFPACSAGWGFSDPFLVSKLLRDSDAGLWKLPLLRALNSLPKRVQQELSRWIWGAGVQHHSDDTTWVAHLLVQSLGSRLGSALHEGSRGRIKDLMLLTYVGTRLSSWQLASLT